MKTIVKYLFLLSGFLFILNGCTPSYPKNKMTESIKKIIKKEYNLDGEAKLIGRTLYLEIKLSGLISTDPKALNDIFKKVQGAALIITRVALSSDADVDFLVLTATDSSWRLNLKIIERMDDIKSYLYQRISRSDYEERLILEIDTNESGVQVPFFFTQQQEIKIGEFVSRLIVAQINMLSRNNPFLSTMLGNSQLKYESFTDTEVVMKLTSPLSASAWPLFEEILTKHAGKIISKYIKEYHPQKINIIGQEKNLISIVIPQVAASQLKK